MRIRLDVLPRLARLAGALLLVVPLMAAAQGAAPAAGSAPEFSKERLDQLTAPIALYPDSLLSQVLMASTYPADVILAAKWAAANKGQSGDEAVAKVQNEPWDTSVQSLVAFPQVIATMGEKPEWVTALGDAFLAQPEDVMNSVQRLRAQAQKAGNLKTNENQIVATEPAQPPPPNVIVQQPATQIITIEPANPQVVFVPTFNPTYVYGPWLWPSYPPYYIPPPLGWGFATAVGVGVAWGVGIGVRNAMWGGVNWGRGDVNINVNRYNNINVNNRINNASGNRQNWNHNAANRKGTPYRDAGTRQRYDNNRVGGAQNRQDYRGRDGAGGGNRDAQRAAAQNTLQNRAPGADFSGSARERAQGVDRSQVQNRAANADRGQAQNRAAAADRAQNFERGSAGRDNALRGAGGNQGNRDMDRGAASRAAQSRDFKQAGASSGNRPGGGGGSMSRPSGGGGGGGVSRPSGGGGGGVSRPSGGGGGGASRPSGGGRPAGGGGGRGGGGGGGGGGRGR